MTSIKLVLCYTYNRATLQVRGQAATPLPQAASLQPLAPVDIPLLLEATPHQQVDLATLPLLATHLQDLDSVV